MSQRICLIVLTLSLLTACSLNQAASVNVKTLTASTPTIAPTPTTSPTEITNVNQPTLVPTSTPIPPSNTASCAITRTDLPIYTVVAGDTLTNIASRTNSTVAELVQINCLSDASQIAVGHQLRVLNSPVQDGNTGQDEMQMFGTLVISPYLSTETDGKVHYHVQGNTVINLKWENMPSNQNISHVELIYVDDHYTVAHVSVGIDTNIADGVSINWAIPNDVQGILYAIGRIPGQHHLSVQSQEIAITSTSTSPQAIGALSIDPNRQAGTPDDWSDYILAPNTAVTITWRDIEPDDFNPVGAIEFIYIPDYGDIQVIGHDTDKSDGISLTWTTPETVLGKIDVSATYGNDNSRIYAPRLHVRTE